MSDDNGDRDKRLHPADLISPELMDAITEAGQIIDLVASCIKAAGAGGVVSGHLYASVMGIVSLSTFNHILGLLEFNGQIERRGKHHLVWIAESKPRQSDR